jgi:hypothetical protein
VFRYKQKVMGMEMDDTNLLVQCDFEVYGHVQGKCNNLLELFVFPIF